MLPTFVIGLREGLEAALIVGIIAAFLRKQGRRDLLVPVAVGVGAAVAACVAAGVALDLLSRDLPQRQQEGLETVIGVLAVAMVTYMVVWMRRHSRELKGQLEGLAAGALAAHSRVGRAMVLMAFLAVIREGLETVVFLLAAFDEAGSGTAAGLGACLGIVAAAGLGYGIYRGGVRLNLSKFFRATGVVLVLVAAGLVVNALHTAHEAGWLAIGQGGTVDLSGIVAPGSVQASLLTGMLGIQARPVVIEAIGWFAYLIPVGCYVAWPPRGAARGRALARWSAATAVVTAGAVAIVLAVVAQPSSEPSAEPAAGSGEGGSGGRVAAVTITAAHGCVPDRVRFDAGPLTVKITNKDATAVSEVELLKGERIVGEKENIPPGFTGQFAVTLGPGGYTLYCPGAATERTAMRVTGSDPGTSDANLAALLAAGTRGYADFVDTQVAGLLRAVGHLDATLHGVDLRAAREAYIAARPFYEKIEPVAESFVVGTDSIDADIDARAGDVPSTRWRGFHRIEKSLFAERTLAGLPSYGDRLVADVHRLRRLTAGLTFQPTELANGAQELLDEVAASKITGEEERYSRIDLLDIAGNTEGAEQAYLHLEPAVRQIDRSLARTISDAFDALDTLVDRYRTAGNPSGYRLYPELTRVDKRALAAAVKAVQEPLSTVASKVANA
jgi:iron uptake system component EfeO